MLQKIASKIASKKLRTATIEACNNRYGQIQIYSWQTRKERWHEHCYAIFQTRQFSEASIIRHKDQTRKLERRNISSITYWEKLPSLQLSAGKLLQYNRRCPPPALLQEKWWPRNIQRNRISSLSWENWESYAGLYQLVRRKYSVIHDSAKLHQNPFKRKPATQIHNLGSFRHTTSSKKHYLCTAG